MTKETKNTETKAVELEDEQLDVVAGGATEALQSKRTAEGTKTPGIRVVASQPKVLLLGP